MADYSWARAGRGRELEEGDRIYRPGCKAKGKFAKRDQDFFLCYEGASTALVNYVFDNGILTPEQVWTPHELSNIDDSNGLAGAENSTENPMQVGSEAAAQTKPKSKHKRKKKIVETKESGKRKKKATRSQEEVSAKNVDFGMHLLQEVNQSILECMTTVNRRWRTLRDEGGLRDENTEWIPALAEEIEASQQDIKLNVWDIVMWARKSSTQSIQVPEDFRLPYFRTWNDGLVELVEKVKRYTQKLVVAVRGCRRALCGGDSTLLPGLQGGQHAYRASTCEYLAIDIAKLQDDLRGAMTEILSEFGGEDQAYDSEKTDTDDES